MQNGERLNAGAFISKNYVISYGIRGVVYKMGWYEMIVETDTDVYAHLIIGVLYGRQWKPIKLLSKGLTG